MNGSFFSAQKTSVSATHDIADRLRLLGYETMDISEANKLSHGKLFDTLISSQGNAWPLYEALPPILPNGLVHLPFPFDAVEHEDHRISNIAISDIIENYVNEKFAREKFLFSADPNVFITLRFEEFSYDIFEILHSRFLTTPFIMFDGTMNNSFIFNFDVCITVFSSTASDKDHFSPIKNDEVLTFFMQNFLAGVVDGNQHHLDVVNCNYVPRIAGLYPFAFEVASTVG